MKNAFVFHAAVLRALIGNSTCMIVPNLLSDRKGDEMKVSETSVP